VAHVDDLRERVGGVHANGARHLLSEPAADRRLRTAALRDGLADDADEVGVVERRGDEDGTLAFGFCFEGCVRPFVRDDDRQVRMVEPAADRELQAVVGAEADVGDQHVGRDRFEQFSGLGERRHGGHEVAVLREEGIGSPERVRVRIDEDHERGHTPAPRPAIVPPVFAKAGPPVLTGGSPDILKG
jgi:hypothetical protein